MKNTFTYNDIEEINLLNVNKHSVTIKIKFNDGSKTTCFATKKVVNKLLHRFNDLACCADELVFGFVGDNYKDVDLLWLAMLSRF